MATLPAAHVCYEPNFNRAACDAVATELTDAEFVAADPVQIFFGNWDGNACPPLSGDAAPGREGACGLGNYSNYVVVAETARDVSLGVRFARQHNLRLVVKGTGHEVEGRFVLD